MNPREMIERALERYFIPAGNRISRNFLLDALAEQIVIECEVEHPYSHMSGKPYTYVRGAHIMGKHHGTPGKAIAIIVGLEEE